MPNKVNKTTIITLLAGSLLTLAFAPFNFAFLALVCPALLAYSFLTATNYKKTFLRGLLFGIGFFATSIYWVFISIHQFGNVPVWLSSIITSGFILLLALFFGFFGISFRAILVKIFKNKNLWETTKTNSITSLTVLFLFPILWLLFEWLRGFIFTGFPWVFLGYSQIHTPFAGFAPIFGVWGVTFLTCFASTIFLLACLTKSFRCLGYFFSFLVVLAIGFGLTHLSWTKRYGKPISVALIQGNIPQSIKWNPNSAYLSLNHYMRATEENLKKDIIIWPENALPLGPAQAKTVFNIISKKATHSSIVLGFPYFRNSKEIYNAAIALGQGHGLYLKQHLVPFGEFIPFQKQLGKLFEFMQIPMSSFSAGPKKQPLLSIGKYKAAIFICYESAYPNEVKNQLQKANFIITISDDTWFGHSIAEDQHEQIEQMRALETGRYILRATNSGITSIINPQGKIIKKIPSFKQGILTGTIRAVKGPTLWDLL